MEYCDVVQHSSAHNIKFLMPDIDFALSYDESTAKGLIWALPTQIQNMRELCGLFAEP